MLGHPASRLPVPGYDGKAGYPRKLGSLQLDASYYLYIFIYCAP
jgi:hypothetical protein